MKILLRLLCLFALLALQPAFAQTLAGASTNLRSAQAGTLIFDYSVEEYAYPYRKGPALVFQYSATSNPWRDGSLLLPSRWPALPNSLGVGVVPICRSDFVAYGGSFGGWLFGPMLPGDPNQALIEIRKFIPEAPAGTQLYTVLAGTSMPDGSWAENIPCSGSITKEKLVAMFAFIFPTSKRMPSGNYQIGDLLLVNMESGGGNWYRVLSPSPLGPVVKSSASVSPPEVVDFSDPDKLGELGKQLQLPHHMLEQIKRARNAQ